LLAALAVPFVVRPANVDESEPAGVPSAELAALIAARKAEVAVEAAGEGDLVLAADTVVVLDGRSLGKPADDAEAAAMLEALAGRQHQVYTAVVLAGRKRRLVETVRTDVLIRRYSAAEIAESIRAGTPFDKAGGYAIQDPLLHPVERFDGCYCNVVGLPLWTVYTLLRAVRERAVPEPPLPPALNARRPDAALQCCATCPLRADAGRMLH
jgi:MAF protein